MLKPALKTTFALSGAMIMMGGGLVLSLSKLINYVDDDADQAVTKSIGATAFFSLVYVLVFSRGISLWNYFNQSTPETANAVTTTENKPLRKSTVVVTALGLSSSLLYFFLGGYLSSNTLLALSNAESTAPQTTLWIYCWGSLMTVYINFTLPRAVKNTHKMIDLIKNGHSDETKSALLKTIACTSLGTLSFGALANFLLNNAQQIMPITKDFPLEAQKTISYSLAAICMSMFALGKSLESYQYFSNSDPTPNQSRHFNRYQKTLLLSHKVMAPAYLIFITGAYFRVNLDLMEGFGLDITPQWAHFPVIASAGLCTASSTFIEAVFSCGSMWTLTQKAFIENTQHTEALVENSTNDPTV